MAIRFPEVVAACVLVPWLMGASGSPPAGGVGKSPVSWEAQSWDLDYQTRVMHLHNNVKISQGEMSVAADEAMATTPGEKSKNSHWVFTGNVHVRAESQGDLHADRATVEIIDGVLASAFVTGSPAQFQQTRASADRLVKGHAATINYDVAAATVRLAGDAAEDAWLTEANQRGRDTQPLHHLQRARQAYRGQRRQRPPAAGCVWRSHPGQTPVPRKNRDRNPAERESTWPKAIVPASRLRPVAGSARR